MNKKKQIKKLLKMSFSEIFSYVVNKNAKKERDREREELMNKIKIRLPK